MSDTIPLSAATHRSFSASAFLRRTGAVLLGATLLAAPGTTQAVRGGDLVTTNYGTPAAVYRVDHTGAVTTLLSGAPLTSPAGITVTRTRDLVVCDFNSGTLIRIDATTGAPSTIASGLGGPLRAVEMLDGDFAVTSANGRSILRVTPAGAVTTLASGAPLNRPFSVSLDTDGVLLVADDLGRGLFRVTPQGVVTPLHTGAPLRLPQGIAVFPDGDYAVIDGVNDEVYRIDRGTSLLTTWVPAATLANNPEGIVADWSGGMLVAHSGAPGGSGIRAIDPLGVPTPVGNSPPWNNLEDLARVPFTAGPGVVGTGPGARFTFSVDVPAAALNVYTLMLAATVHPGVRLPGDPRSFTVNPDALFVSTFGRDTPPFLVGFTGVLDRNGRANATLDLQLLPPGLLSGVTLWQQGTTLTPVGTFGTLLNPLRLDFP